MNNRNEVESERIEFGKVIKSAREEAGLSLRALGEILGKNPSTILNYERGNVKINETTKQKLLKALNLPYNVTTIIDTTINRNKAIIKSLLILKKDKVVKASAPSELEIPISWAMKYESLYGVYVADNLIVDSFPTNTNLVVAKGVAPEKDNFVHFYYDKIETIGIYVEDKNWIHLYPDVDQTKDSELENISIDKSDDYEMMSLNIIGTVIGYISDINVRP